MIPMPKFRALGEMVMLIVFPRLESRLHLFFFFFFFWWFGKWGAGGGERMLPNHQKAKPASWGDAKIWQSSWRPPHKAHPKTPDTPPPCRELHFSCDLAQPAVRKEPLNTSPEQRRLKGLRLPSSAGSPFSVFPCSPLSAPFTTPSSSDGFCFVFLMQPIFPPLSFHFPIAS